jgi:branched-chain amino acid transport system substrate-binding protein
MTKIASALRATLALAASVIVVSLPAWAEEPVKIGVLTDESGNFAALSGQGSVTAAKMAVEDFGGTVLGRPIQIIDADHKNRTDLGLQIAREWYDGGVIAIADVVNSSIALGVQDLAKQKQRFALLSGPGTVDITGPRCNPYTYLWTWDTYADATVPVRAITNSGGKDWFFLAADFAFGAAMQRDAAAALIAVGGTVSGSVKAPLGETDFSSYLLQAQSSGANVLALANGGIDTINSIKQAAEFGLMAKMRVAALALNITDIHSLGLEKAQGILVTEGFYWDHDDASRAWGRRFFERQHAMPAQSQAGTYSVVLHFLQAIKAAGSTDPDAVAAKMRALPIDDAFAHDGHLRSDGRMVHDMFLMQVKTPSESKYPWDYYKVLATLPGDQAFRPQAAGGCPIPP